MTARMRRYRCPGRTLKAQPDTSEKETDYGSLVGLAGVSTLGTGVSTCARTVPYVEPGSARTHTRYRTYSHTPSQASKSRPGRHKHHHFRLAARELLLKFAIL